MIGEEIVIEMPDYAQFLTCDVQKNVPYMWVLTNPEDPHIEKRFYVYATGFSEIRNDVRYLATFQIDDGDYVFHLFEPIMQNIAGSGTPQHKIDYLSGGTPSHRLDYLLGELDKRFPGVVEATSSEPPEPKYIAEIDKLIVWYANTC